MPVASEAYASVLGLLRDRLAAYTSWGNTLGYAREQGQDVSMLSWEGQLQQSIL